MNVTMKNPRSGELKTIKIGWSWTLFFFASFLGIPLFLRGLNVWGCLFIAVWVLLFIFPPGMIIVTPASLFAHFYLLVKGNELTAKNYLNQGWEFSQPESDIVRLAKMKWSLIC